MDWNNPRYVELNNMPDEMFVALPRKEQLAIGREIAEMFGEKPTEQELEERLDITQRFMALPAGDREEAMGALLEHWEAAENAALEEAEQDQMYEEGEDYLSEYGQYEEEEKGARTLVERAPATVTPGMA